MIDALCALTDDAGARAKTNKKDYPEQIINDMYRNLREKLKPIADQLLTQSGRDGFEDDRLDERRARAA